MLRNAILLPLLIVLNGWYSEGLGQDINKLELRDPCEIDSSCTEDPTYRFFEKEQLSAFCNVRSGKMLFNKLLNLSQKEQARIFNSVIRALDGRQNSIPSLEGLMSPEGKKHLSDEMSRKLPTCYEDPYVYSLISYFMSEVEKARIRLRLPLKIIPKYGSLPTSEINAYTYPPDTAAGNVDMRGSVIGFNRQLFMFAYQMTKITLPTIGVVSSNKSNFIEIDASLKAAKRAILLSPSLKRNFTNALLEFTQHADPSTQPIDPKFDAPLITFAMAIELFAVCHEYGHLIKDHQIQDKRKLRLGLKSDGGDYESVVGLRSWHQELEADSMGLVLMIEVLRNQLASESFGKVEESRFIYKLYAPLFFFACADIIENTKFFIDSGYCKPKPKIEEVDYFRSLASREATKVKQASGIKQIFLQDHPPGWLRQEKMIKYIAGYLKKGTFSDESLKQGILGQAIIENVDLIWSSCIPKFNSFLDSARNQGSIRKSTYTPAPNYWDIAFLDNPYLEKATTAFINQNLSDKEYTKLFYDAVKADWLLLSGIQNRWAEDWLRSNEISLRQNAVAVLALTGDIQSANFLKGLDISSWTDSDTGVLKKAINYLGRNGRNTSVSGLLNISAKQFKLSMLFSHPTFGSDLNIDSLLPQKLHPYTLEFLENNRDIVLGKSMSPVALYMALTNVTPERSYSFWADVLIRASYPDSALSYATMGLAKGGGKAILENTIGNILTAKGNLKEAIDHYNISLSHGRKDGWPELNIAKNYDKLDNLGEAEKWFRKAIDRDPFAARSISEYAEYLNEFAWFLVTRLREDRNKIKEALKLSIMSNKLVNYQDPNFLDTLAECLATNGNEEQAVKVMASALKLVSFDSEERTKYEQRYKEFQSRVIKQNKK
ncbi:hypothetical protein GZH53_06725 [Flavihumibacter sp. R14]|nr:hypothetical protein [Flavihumibacter soli]